MWKKRLVEEDEDAPSKKRKKVFEEEEDDVRCKHARAGAPYFARSLALASPSSPAPKTSLYPLPMSETC